MNWTYNHRIIECFGLEGTFIPCSKQGHLQLDQVAQSPAQPGLECFQGWGLHYLSGQPVPVFHYPYGRIGFLTSCLNLPSLSLKPLLLLLLQRALLKIFSPSFLQAPFRYCKAAITSPRSLLFSRRHVLLVPPQRKSSRWQVY